MSKEIILENKIRKKIVKVLWTDAHCHTDSSLIDAISKPCTEKETIGYLIYEDDDRITLCWDYDLDGGGNENNGVYSIPKGMIHDIEELVPKK